MRDIHTRYGAQLADDGIPLQYGDLLAEYRAALDSAVVLDRSHEGRIQLTGSKRFEFLNRMSTNKLVNMAAHEGRPTIFTNPNARIIQRIIAYNRDDHLLLITEPGQNTNVMPFLQRQIFFGDDVQLTDLTPTTNQFGLHGPDADTIMQTYLEDDVPALHSAEVTIADKRVFAARRKTISGAHWALVVARDDAADVYEALVTADAKPAGSLTYNTLRIRAGRPAGRELSGDYIPLEVGLWDEVSFDKGCYTGQEIIARMESRGRLAKTIVSLQLANWVAAPAEIKHENRKVGTLTSSVQAPDGSLFAIGIIKTDAARSGTNLQIGETTATVQQLLGEQPPYIEA